MFCLEVGGKQVLWLWNEMLRKGSNSTLANNLPVQSVGVELHSQSQELQFVPPSPAKEVQVRVTRLRAMQI